MKEVAISLEQFLHKQWTLEFLEQSKIKAFSQRKPIQDHKTRKKEMWT